MQFIRVAACLSLICAAGAASAQSLAFNLGTTGVGIEGGYGLTEHVGIRGSYGAGSYPYAYTESGIRYDADVKFSVGLLTADLHPFKGVFRISAGLGYNNTRIEGNAEPVNGTVVVNGVTYTASQVGTVEGEVHFQKTAPYLGFGWGNAAKSTPGWFFTSDFGVLFSKATGSVTGTCAPATAGTPVCTQLQNDLQAEARDFVTEAEKVKYYPVVRIGVGYRF